jgi:PspA/IM30 family
MQPNSTTGPSPSALILPDMMDRRPGRQSSPPAPLTELAPVAPFQNAAPFYKLGLDAARNHYRSFPMGIFSRTRDIIAANVTDLLDKSQDPAKMIRMIIMEMEETLVEVRAAAYRQA